MHAIFSRCLVLLFAFGISAGAAEERIEAGVLALDVHISRTAVLFHVVDQLSEWSYFSHRQYGRAFAPLSDADRAMLEKHKAVRAGHSWGEGLEQTFYSPRPLDEALASGVAQGWLSAEEAAAEREVLRHFAPRIETLLAAQSDTLVAFREKLRRELAARSALIAQFARFTGKAPDLVPVYLIPDPDAHSMGGGYNGGRLTVEVPTQADAMPTTLHELFHAFLNTRKAEIEAAVSGVPGLDLTRLFHRNAPELPDFVKQGDSRHPTGTEFFVACKEWVDGTYRQMSQFYSRAGHEMIFTAAGHPDVRGHLNGHTVSSGDGTFQAYGLEIVAEDRDKIVPGVAYGIKPINTNETYRWQVSAAFIPVILQD